MTVKIVTAGRKDLSRGKVLLRTNFYTVRASNTTGHSSCIWR